MSEETPAPDICDDQISKKTILKYIGYAVCIAVIAALIYYAYCQFILNTDGFIKDSESEKSDTASDFNLYAAIDRLKKQQASILNQLSPG
jgi:uncharacterized membrane protein YukC